MSDTPEISKVLEDNGAFTNAPAVSRKEEENMEAPKKTGKAASKRSASESDVEVPKPPSKELLSAGMLDELVSAFYIHTASIGILRFQDNSSTVYQLDPKGGGKFELRPVRD